MTGKNHEGGDGPYKIQVTSEGSPSGEGDIDIESHGDLGVPEYISRPNTSPPRKEEVGALSTLDSVGDEDEDFLRHKDDRYQRKSRKFHRRSQRHEDDLYDRNPGTSLKVGIKNGNRGENGTVDQPPREEISQTPDTEPATPQDFFMDSLGSSGSGNETVREIIDQEIEAELYKGLLENLSPEEKEKAKWGIHNFGHKVQASKARGFAKAFGFVSSRLDASSTQGRFFTALKEQFDTKEKKALDEIQSLEEKKAKGDGVGAWDDVRNVGSFTGNLLMYGRVAADLGGVTAATPLRVAMVGTMVAASGAEAAKEARLKNEDVIERNRIQLIEEAAEEAWRIHEQAERRIQAGEKVSREDIQKMYEELSPKDILKRLAENPQPFTGTKILQFVFQKHVNWSVSRLDEKFAKIDRDTSLSEEQKAFNKEKILNGWLGMGSKRSMLKDYDRLLTQQGTLDTLGMFARYGEQSAKVAVAAMMANSIDKLWDHFSDVLSNSASGAYLDDAMDDEKKAQDDNKLGDSKFRLEKDLSDYVDKIYPSELSQPVPTANNDYNGPIDPNWKESSVEPVVSPVLSVGQAMDNIKEAVDGMKFEGEKFENPLTLHNDLVEATSNLKYESGFSSDIGIREAIGGESVELIHTVEKGENLSTILFDVLKEKVASGEIKLPDHVTKDGLAHYMYQSFPEMTSANGVSPTLTPDQWLKLVGTENPHLIRPGQELNLQPLIDKMFPPQNNPTPEVTFSAPNISPESPVGDFNLDLTLDAKDVNVDGGTRSESSLNLGDMSRVNTEVPYPGDLGIVAPDVSVEAPAPLKEAANMEEILVGDTSSTPVETEVVATSGEETQAEFLERMERLGVGVGKISEKYLEMAHQFIPGEGVPDLQKHLTSVLTEGTISKDIVLPLKYTSGEANFAGNLSEFIKFRLPELSPGVLDLKDHALTPDDWRALGIASGNPLEITNTDVVQTGVLMEFLFNDDREAMREALAVINSK